MEQKGKFNSVFFAIFCIIFAATFGAVVFFAVINQSSQYNQSKSFTQIEDWETSSGEKTVLDRASYFNNGLTIGKYSLVAQIPRFSGNQTLIINSCNVDIEIYADGKYLGSLRNEPDLLRGISYGQRWTTVDIDDSCSEKKLMLRVTDIFGDGIGCIKSVYFGHQNSILLGVMVTALPGFILSILIIFLAFAFIIVDILLIRHLNHKHAVMYFGFFLLLIGFWSLLNSQVVTALLSDFTYLDTISSMMFLLFLLPFILYLSSTFKSSGKKLFNTIIIILICNYIICCALHFSGIVYFHYTLLSTSFIYIISIIATTIKCGYSYIKAPSVNKHNKYVFIGQGIVFVCVVLDLLLYITIADSDNLLFIKVGIICLSTTVASVTISEMTSVVKLGLRADLIGKLAYTDGLTNIGNTTAFREKLDNLEMTKTSYRSIGIIQFDINNLKTVNDKLGHDFGDKLICNGAEVITKAFSSIGDCYRIGGDEFAVIITADHAPQRCEEAVDKFERLIDEFNSANHEFKLQIAYGVAFYENGEGLFLREIQKQADMRMYNKKRQMKQSEPRDTIKDTTIQF